MLLRMFHFNLRVLQYFFFIVLIYRTLQRQRALFISAKEVAFVPSCLYVCYHNNQKSCGIGLDDSSGGVGCVTNNLTD